VTWWSRWLILRLIFLCTERFVKYQDLDKAITKVPQNIRRCWQFKHQLKGWVQNHAKWRFGWKKKFSRKGLNSACGPQCNRKTQPCIFVAGFCFVFELYCMQKYLAFPSHVFRSLFDEQQTGRLFIVYEVKIKSHSIYRAEIREQIVYISYCDMNTTRESIERQMKYIKQKRDVPH